METEKNNLIEVGVAKQDITPDYPIRLSGYGSRRTESEGIIQRIWAKGLAIGSDADEPVVLVAVENCGLPDELTEEVADRVREKKWNFTRTLRGMFYPYAQRAVPNKRRAIHFQFRYSTCTAGKHRQVHPSTR